MSSIQSGKPSKQRNPRLLCRRTSRNGKSEPRSPLSIAYSSDDVGGADESSDDVASEDEVSGEAVSPESLAASEASAPGMGMSETPISSEKPAKSAALLGVAGARVRVSHPTLIKMPSRRPSIKRFRGTINNVWHRMGLRLTSSLTTAVDH